MQFLLAPLMLLVPPPRFDDAAAAVPVPKFTAPAVITVAPMPRLAMMSYRQLLDFVETLKPDQEVIVAAGVPATNCSGTTSEAFPGEAPGLYRCWLDAGKPRFAAFQPPAAALPVVPAVVKAVGGYPVRGGWWSGCSSWAHLTVGPHAGKFSSAWLQSLSWAELQSLHSDDHEGRVKWSSVQRGR